MTYSASDFQQDVLLATKTRSTKGALKRIDGSVQKSVVRNLLLKRAQYHAGFAGEQTGLAKALQRECERLAEKFK